MTSHAIQGWHPNPQLMQPQQQAPPQGWTGSWPPGGNVAFPPGYPGPPPIPGGAAPHPSWSAGYWQYNPMAMQNAQQPWAPGVGWFPPNYNPYKRIPKPPSPSYWNTKLSDNGLGLEGMVKRKDPSDHNGGEAHTPWIWNPPSLLESGDRATPTKDFNPRRSGSVDPSTQTVSTPTRDQGRSGVRSPQESLNTQVSNQTPESSSRSSYFYSPQDNFAPPPAGPARHTSDPSDFRPALAAIAGPSTASHRSADSWFNRTRAQPPAPNEVPPYPAPTPTLSRSASAQQTTFTQEPESFTSRGELQPTFSSNIVRTPTYYQHGRRSVDELSPTYHSRSPSSGGGHSSRAARGPPAPEPVTRQSSLPNVSSSTRDVYSSFSEDLSNSLPASASSRARTAGTAGPLSRSRTESAVANLTTIPESSSALSSGELYLAPLRDPSAPSSAESSPDPSPRHRDRRSSPYGSSPHEPEPALYRDRRPSPYAARHAHTRSASHSPSPLASPRAASHARDSYASTSSGGGSGMRRDAGSSSSSGGSGNPLPPPPVERANPEASRPPVQEPSPPRYARKARVGFWNRRGDHLTPNSYVVYAPQGRAYPEELRDYPGEREGYRDQFGSFAPWRQERPELPSSLPYHGRAPTQPYESFVVYTYLQ